jgi:aerobic carbon-monoxide dehydrogenase medium subunit
LAVSEFVIGAYTTVREPDEILTSIHIPIIHGQVVAYEQFKIVERPTVGVAAVRLADKSVRVVVGAVGSLAQKFEGRAADIDPADIARRVEVIADLSGTERYKRHLTEVLARRALQRLDNLA